MMRATPRRLSGSTELQVGTYVPPAGAVFGAEAIGTLPTDTGTLWRVVRRAAAAIRDLPADIAPPSDLLAEERSDAIDALCTAWKRAYSTGCGDTRGVSLPERATLDRLRAAFLAELAALPDGTDSAEVVRMLAALELVRERLDRDEAQRFRKGFAGGNAMDLVVEVSHDMRSPLSAILLLTDALRRAPAGTLPPVAQRQIGLVYSAAFGLHAMANDVIELARGGERLFDPEPMSFSVGEIMQGAGDIVRPMAEEKQLALHVVGPRVDSRVGHPLALSRVLVNLTTNALKFTREGEVRVLARELSRTAVEFSVEDTGIGIPPEVMRSLFDPFRRLQRGATLENAFSSAGLGLAICRRLVAAMGSELTVTTEMGKGTRFSFVLSLPTAGQTI